MARLPASTQAHDSAQFLARQIILQRAMTDINSFLVTFGQEDEKSISGAQHSPFLNIEKNHIDLLDNLRKPSIMPVGLIASLELDV
ncbi:hypothetical protein RJZ57_002876 [Blastomyces gilchristii]